MDAIRQALDKWTNGAPPDLLLAIGALLVVLILRRMALISIKVLLGTALLVAVLLGAWRTYLWIHS